MSMKRNYSKKLSKTIALAVMAMSVAGFASVASAEEPVDTIFGSSATITGQYTAASETAQITNPLDKEEIIDVKKATITASSDLTVNSATALNGDKFYSTTVDMANNALSVHGNDNGIVVGVDASDYSNIMPTNLAIKNLKSLDLVKDTSEARFAMRDIGQGSRDPLNVGIGVFSLINNTIGGGAEYAPTYAAIADITTTGDVNVKNYAVGLAVASSGINKDLDNRVSGININAGGDVNLVGNGQSTGGKGIYATGKESNSFPNKYTSEDVKKFYEEANKAEINVVSNGKISVTDFETALVVKNGASVNLKAKGDIILESLGNYGILNQGLNSNPDYRMAGNVELTSEEGTINISGQNYGIYLDIHNGGKGAGNISINGNVKIKGNTSCIELMNSNDNTVSIKGNTILEGGKAASLFKGNLEIYGNLVAEEITNGFSINSGRLVIDGSAIVKATDAIQLKTSTGILNLKEDSNIDGNIRITNGSSANITMNNSVLKGNINVDSSSLLSLAVDNNTKLNNNINIEKKLSKDEVLKTAANEWGYNDFGDFLKDWYGSSDISLEDAAKMDGMNDINQWWGSWFNVGMWVDGEQGLNLTLNKESELNGSIIGGGEANVTLNEGSVWTVTADSQLTKLSGTDGVIKPGKYTVTTQAAAEGTSVNVVGEGDLNAIANKIFYTNYVTGEKNLSAKAVIEGKAARESAEMLFKDEDGQGYINTQEATDTEIFGEYNESINNKNTNVTVTETGTWAPTGENAVPSLKGEAGSAVDMRKADSLEIGSYSGETTMLYGHDESDPTNIIGGDVNIGSAEQGSKITMSTDGVGINTSNNAQVAAVMNAMAKKLTYEDAALDEGVPAENNLTGTVKIAEGLTSSSAAISVGDIKFDENGQGTVDESTIETVGQKGDEETAVMKSVKGALLSSALMMRAESNDLLKRMGDVRLAEADRGLWAKYYGGKYEINTKEVDTNLSYKAYQLGYDTKAGKNWTVGGAVSYNDGKSGKSDLKNTAVGVYGTWNDAKGQYVDLIAKVGWLKNDFDVVAAGHRIEDSMKTTGISMSAEYGKRMENKAGAFVEPSAELTFGHLNGKKVNAKADGGANTLGVDQDAFNSMVGRLGIRIGQKTANSSVYAKLALAHEFCGDFDVTFSAPGEPTKKASVGLKDTWGEFQIGGTTKLGKAGLLYANYQRSFAGDVKEKYRVDAGLRWTF